MWGLFNLDGQPVAPERLAAMQRAMARWGFDRPSTWQSGSVGIGHSPQHNTPGARLESGLLRHAPTGVVLAAQVRLDNRRELIADLRLPACGDTWPQPTGTMPATPGLSDYALLLHAYLRWGQDCGQHLIGDWILAAWDPRHQKLFLARDHGGVSSLYYCRGPHRFAFASFVQGLLALPDVPNRPNLLNAARLLTTWLDGDDGRETAYEGIYRLTAGQTLTVSAGQVEARRYWFPEHTPTRRLASNDEYLDAFLEVYTEAVRCRLHTASCPLPPPDDGERWGAGPSPSPCEGEGRGEGLGATLSGGLDSGSVCALAARELRATGRRLPVLTAVPLYDTQAATPPRCQGDESSLVELNRQFIGNLDVHYVRARDSGPLASAMRGLEIHDHPIYAADNLFWIYALLASARQMGLGVLLLGQGGNHTVSWAGSTENGWPLLLSGQWPSLWVTARRSGLSPWQMVRQHLLRPIVLGTRQALRDCQGPGRQPWAPYSAINPAWVRDCDLVRQIKASRPGPFGDPLQTRVNTMMATASGAGTFNAEVGAAYGLEVRDPTMDRRVVEFCLSIPGEQYRLDGQSRALIRRAMKGLLPDEVRLNRRRGLQAADLGHRLLAELPQAQAALARLEESALARRVLDLSRMRGVLEALQREVNVQTTVACRTILMRGLMIGMFLSRFEAHDV